MSKAAVISLPKVGLFLFIFLIKKTNELIFSLMFKNQIVSCRVLRGVSGQKRHGGHGR